MSAGGRAIGGPAGVLALTALLAAGAPPRVAAQCPDGSLPPCRAARPALDTARYVILPFVHREGSGSSLLDGADCAEYLSESFGRWSDVRLADRTRIYDALERRGARAPFRIGFGTGLAIARELGAGRLVMGQLWSAADTLRLTVGVYDAARGGPPLREAKARMAANSTRAGTAFDALADSLLAADPGAFSGAGTEQTHSIAALRAYTQGARAIRTWDLASATQHLRAAIAADSDFARAYASLGQVLLWAADSTPQAMRDRAAIARRTGGLLEQLGTTERPLLLAQQAMFERRWPDACARYREVLQRDSANFDAWYGLAQCNAEDPVVIRDPADTMRFVFRGSWHTAVLAYTKALLLAPSFNFVFGTRARQRQRSRPTAWRFIPSRAPRSLAAPDPRPTPSRSPEIASPSSTSPLPGRGHSPKTPGHTGPSRTPSRSAAGSHPWWASCIRRSPRSRPRNASNDSHPSVCATPSRPCDCSSRRNNSGRRVELAIRCCERYGRRPRASPEWPSCSAARR